MFSYSLQKCLLTAALSTTCLFGASQDETPSEPMSLPGVLTLEEDREFFVSGSFLFWQPVQENMSLGVVSNTEDALVLVNGYEVDLDTAFRPGFQVAIGTLFKEDNWSLGMTYTWYRAEESASISLDNTETTTNLLPAWQIADFLNPQYHAGSEEWTLNMDVLDLVLAKGCHVSNRFVLTPFVGIRGAWIRQKLDVDYVNTNVSYTLVWPSTFIRNSIRSWGVGPRVGVGSDWDLGASFRLTANAAFDMLYTQYTTRSTQTSHVAVASHYILKTSNDGYVRTHADLECGFGWGTYLANKQAHIDLLALYGFQAFFDQNMFRVLKDTQATGQSQAPNGTLYLQGLTFAVRLDF